MHPHLARFIQAHLSDAPLPALPPGIAEVARAHRLSGFLYSAGAALSPEDEALCERDWGAQLWAHLQRLKILRKVWPRWAPPPLIIKGADVGERVFEDPGARPANDLDLIAPPGAFDRICGAWSRAADEAREASYARFPWEPSCAMGFVFDGALIEVHEALLPPHQGGPSGQGLWARGREGRLQQRLVRHPHPVDRLLIFYANSLKDAGRVDLLDQLELGLLLRSAGLAQGAAEAVAGFHGLGRAARRLRARPSDKTTFEPNHARFHLRKLALLPPARAAATLARAAWR